MEKEKFKKVCAFPSDSSFTLATDSILFVEDKSLDSAEAVVLDRGILEDFGFVRLLQKLGASSDFSSLIPESTDWSFPGVADSFKDSLTELRHAYVQVWFLDM